MWEEPALQEPFDIIMEDGLHIFDANVCFLRIASNGYYHRRCIEGGRTDVSRKNKRVGTSVYGLKVEGPYYNKRI